MNLKNIFLLMILVLVVGIGVAQNYDVTFEKKSNYNEWGKDWDSVFVVKNGIVTLAAVPKIGGRIMQYDLGSHPSIYVDESNKGLMPIDGDMMVGGFRMLPSPQSDFGWPSPPKLDCGEYKVTIKSNSPDSVEFVLESPIEDATATKYQKHKGLQFKRTITLYRSSTRVKVLMTMLNKGQQNMQHGIWDITQVICSNNGSEYDTNNIWVYFKRNPSSKLGKGAGYVRYSEQSPSDGSDRSQWLPDGGGEGIFAAQYKKKVGKIGADCKDGWISYVDKHDGYAYVKTFTYEEGKTYPDSGASVQVYTYSNYPTLEVEVLGPLVDLKPGDSTIMEENWYAARSLGPVIFANKTGLVTRKLTAKQNEKTINLKGCFGVFHVGTLKYQFCKNTNDIIKEVDSVNVLPTDSIVVDKDFEIPSGATHFQLALYNEKKSLVGILDSVKIPEPLDVMEGEQKLSCNINLSFVNKTLTINLYERGIFNAEIYRVNGRKITSAVLYGPTQKQIDLSNVKSGIVVVKLSGKKATKYLIE